MVSEMKKKFESTLFVIVAVGSSLLTIVILVAGGGYIKDSDKKQPRDPKSITASAVLLPDYTWHVVADERVHFNSGSGPEQYPYDGSGFCFKEDLGGQHIVWTCAPHESFLGWRIP
jgi:hypothetical protein